MRLHDFNAQGSVQHGHIIFLKPAVTNEDATWEGPKLRDRYLPPPCLNKHAEKRI